MSTAPQAAPLALDPSRIRAISIDLDDTLWPIWPTIERAEAMLASWLSQHAPATARLYATPGALREARNHLQTLRPDLAHDLSCNVLETTRRWPSPRSTFFLTSASACSCSKTPCPHWNG